MFKNHIVITWRSIKKDKLLTGIKIGGFALGIAVCLLISLFVVDETNYDTYYAKKDQIYRMILQGNLNGETIKNVYFQLPFAEVLETDFPEIEKAGRLNTSALFGAGKRSFKVAGTIENYMEDGFVFADQKLLEILEVRLIMGDPKKALIQPGGVVISQSKANKYFPDGNALGKTVVLDGNANKPYTVTGVMADLPLNTHVHFDFILPIEDTNRSWTSTNYFTYVLLDKQAQVQEVEKKLSAILDDYVIPAQVKDGLTPDLVAVLKTFNYKLQPIDDIYLKSDIKMDDRLKHGDIRFVWLFTAIAGFILLLACINFINLSTAKSTNRAKEVGLRKTIGAFKRNLVAQFLTESIVLAIISFGLGICLAWLLLPIFNDMAAKAIVMPWHVLWFFPILLVSSVAIGALAGLYPAFYLSAFRPVNMLKGNQYTGGKKGKVQSGLVIFQFATSVVLIICTLVVYGQMNFILDKKLGYDEEQVLVIEGGDLLGNRADYFKEQLKQLPSVVQVSQSGYLPIEGSKRNGTTFTVTEQGDNSPRVWTQIWNVDYDYMGTLGMQLLEGRAFSPEIASDSTRSIIINESMLAELGLKDPLGEKINNGHQEWTIIGVVRDFHFKSLKETITPLAMVIGTWGSTIVVKLHTGNMRETLSTIRKVWDENVPDQSFGYSFLDQDFAQMHADVVRMGHIFNSFALFAISVACLGLFALSAFMAEQRRKEIGIRKVLGAPFKSIYRLLTWDFLRLILMAIAIAVPVGWYIMKRWLEDFAYRIELGWEPFALAGTLALAIAVLTMSYQFIGVAKANPAKSLRTE